MTAAKMPHEADRQLPIGGEIFLDHVGHFVRDPQAASAALARAGFAPTPVSVQIQPPTARRPAPATSPRCSRAATSRCCSRPPTRRSAANSTPRWRAIPACILLRSRLPTRRRAPAARRCRLAHAAAGAVPAPGRDRERARMSRPSRWCASSRRDGGGPHPVAHAPHRRHGVAAALARRIPNGALGLIDLLVVSASMSAEAAARFARFTGRRSPPTTFGQSIAARSRPGADRDRDAFDRAGAGDCERRACRSSAPMRCGCRRCATEGLDGPRDSSAAPHRQGAGRAVSDRTWRSAHGSSPRMPRDLPWRA